MQPESEEEGGEREPEEEAGPEEREEEGEVEESTEDAARRAEHQNHVHARRACLNYAEYIMFQRKTRESRARYVENMAKLGIEITAENESNNALIRREVVEEDDGAYEEVVVEGEEGDSEVSWDPDRDGKDERKPREPLDPPRRTPAEPPYPPPKSRPVQPAYPPPGFSTSVRDVRRPLRSRSREAEEIVQRWVKESEGVPWEDVPPWRKALIQRGKGRGKGKRKGRSKKKGGIGRDDPIHEPKDPRGPPGGGKGPDGGGSGSGTMREEARSIAVRMLQVPQMPVGGVQAVPVGRERRGNHASVVRTRWLESRIDEEMDRRQNPEFGDYWEYWGHRGLLRRHHTQERQELFGHAAEDEGAWREAPITRAALDARRRSTLIRVDQTGIIHCVHDSWVFREEEDQRRPTVCDTPWIGYTDFAAPGLEPLGFLPPYDPSSALSEPGSEEDWDILSQRSLESSTGSPRSDETDPPMEREDHDDRRTWLTCGSTMMAWCGGQDLPEDDSGDEGRPGSSRDARSVPRLRMLRKVTTPSEEDEEDRWTVVTEKRGDAVPGGAGKDSVDKGGYGGSEQEDTVSVKSSISKTMEVGKKKVSMACTMWVTVEKKDENEEKVEEPRLEKDEKAEKATSSEVSVVREDSSFAVESIETVEKKEEVEKGKGSGEGIANPWNAFQHANRGKKWSMERMREEYRKFKEATGTEKITKKEKP